MVVPAAYWRRLSLFWLILFLCQAAPVGAQEKPPAQAVAPAESPVTPESLPQVLTEGAAGLEKALAQLKEGQDQSRQVYHQATADIQGLKTKISTLKASWAVGELNVAQAEAELKGLSQGQEQVATVIKNLRKSQEKVDQERQARTQSRGTLQVELAKLEKSGHPVSRSPELKKASSRYLAVAREYEKEADRLHTLLAAWLKELERGHQDLAEDREYLAAYLEEAWWAKLLTRSTYVTLAQEVWSRVVETWKAFLALPARLAEWLTQTARSGTLGGYLKDKAGPLLGLALALILTGVSTLRLRRYLSPRLQAWQAQAEELGVQVILCFGHLLASHLVALGLWAWLVVAVWSLSLGAQPAARLTVLAGGVLLARRVASRLVNRVFAGPAAGGILPLVEATARFYRRNLRRLVSYVLFLGIFGLQASRLLGFSAGSQELLRYVFQVGLLGWTVWALRTSVFETLVSELPVPAWFKRRGVLKSLRSLVFAVLSIILLAGLLGFQNLSAYLAQAAASSGLLIVLSWLLWQGLRTGLKFALHPQRGRLAGRLPVREETRQRSYRTITNSALGLLVLATAVAALRFWGIKPAHLSRFLEVFTYGPVLGPVHLTPLSVGSAILIIYLGLWLSRLARAFLDVNLFPRLEWDRGLSYTVSATLHYLVLIITLLLALNAVGFPLTNLALVAGALGVGIGFGLQNIVNNFISGLILLFERPIKVGDLLVVDGQWGTVKEIRVRSTIFQTVDRAVLIIPNSELLSSKIVNWTHYGWGKVRLTLKVGVAYGSDVRLVSETIRQVCQANERVVHDPPPQVFFEAFGDHALQFTVWVFVKSPGERVPATHELNAAILAALTSQGIEIPFPQQELTIKQWPLGGPGLAP